MNRNEALRALVKRSIRVEIDLSHPGNQTAFGLSKVYAAAVCQAANSQLPELDFRVKRLYVRRPN